MIMFMLKLETKMEYILKKRPERSFSLIIWIENFPRYFVYNFSRKKFLMTEIQFSKD